MGTQGFICERLNTDQAASVYPGTPAIVSFGIFAPRNPLVLAGFLVSAAAVCGAILLILQMYNPHRGLIQVSDAPLRAAMEQLGR